MKKDQKTGIIHMEEFNEEDTQTNNTQDISEIAKNEINMDSTSIVNRLSVLLNENEIQN